MWCCSIVICLSWWVSPARSLFVATLTPDNRQLESRRRDGWGGEDEREENWENSSDLSRGESKMFLTNTVHNIQSCLVTPLHIMRKDNSEGRKISVIIITLFRIVNHPGWRMTNMRRKAGGLWTESFRASWTQSGLRAQRWGVFSGVYPRTVVRIKKNKWVNLGYSIVLCMENWPATISNKQTNGEVTLSHAEHWRASIKFPHVKYQPSFPPTTSISENGSYSN